MPCCMRRPLDDCGRELEEWVDEELTEFEREWDVFEEKGERSWDRASSNLRMASSAGEGCGGGAVRLSAGRAR